MKKLIRFGVSLDHHLLDDFDLHIKKRKYTNRSEALTGSDPGQPGRAGVGRQ